jgi:glucosyl-dolichyl phosphate glucuronosyltransferase
VRITVAICTWNRSKLLDRTLAAMRRLVIPEGVDWEVLVVNNNSSDRTDEVLATHASSLPIRRLFQARPGKSHAANLAIEEAAGDLILWTDDDVLVDPRWLAEYVEAARLYPEAAYFGGTVDPLFEVDPPGWIRRHLTLLGDIYAVRQLGEEVRPLRPHESPYGANMAIRREAHEIHRFDINLGPSGDNQIRGEEVVLFQGMRRRGLVGVWVGTAQVRHFIPAERLNRRYVWDWYYGLGRTCYRQQFIDGCAIDLDGTRLGPYPRWLVRQSLEASLAAWTLSPWKGTRWLLEMQRSARLRGVMREISAGAN